VRTLIEGLVLVRQLFIFTTAKVKTETEIRQMTYRGHRLGYHLRSDHTISSLGSGGQVEWLASEDARRLLVRQSYPLDLEMFQE
jgi:hypothetical protein